MKIAYLAPKGTYCYEACQSYIENKENIELIENRTITDAILSVVEKKVEKAIVPIENSIQGSVFETIDTLLEHEELYIEKELVLDIEHYLLANQQYEYDEIKEIYSHPQALAQCRNYLQQHFSQSELKQTSSTAQAAEKIKNMPYCACIANKACIRVYDLKVLDFHIQDRKNNQTRFIVLNGTRHILEENLHTSIMFSVSNQPGELYKVLGLFQIFDINLTKIESRPAKTKLGEYIFWVNFEGRLQEEHIKILLEQVKKRCSYFRILGTY